MAKKKELTTFSYPSHMVTEYIQLMNSKESFLKKVSGAGARKLENLYDQLKECWELNITKDLKEILDQKYLELRKIQSEIKGDWRNYEKITAKEELQNIKNAEEYLAESKSSFKNTLEDWKDDILEREESLRMKKIELKQKSQRLNSNFRELSPEQKELAILLKKKERLLIELNSTSKTYDLNLTDYQNDIDSMESELENALESKRKELTLKEKEYNVLLTPHQVHLQKKNSDWNKSMFPIEQNLKNKLSQLEKSKKVWKESITNLENELKSDTERLEKEYLKNLLKEAIKEVGGLPKNMRGWEDLKSPSWLITKLEGSTNDFKKLTSRELKKRNLSRSKAEEILRRSN